MTSTRGDLLESISGLREDYGDELQSMYTTWLSSDPENLDLIDVTGITECYNQGQIYSHTANDGAGGCIDPGELPDEWSQTFDNPIGGYFDSQGNLITDDDTTYVEDQTPVNDCLDSNGFWDYEKGECTYPGDVEGGEEYMASQEEWEETGSGFEEESYTFQAAGQTWDLVCPEGMVPHTNAQGHTGCISEGEEYNYLTGEWTEQFGVFDQSLYDQYVATGEMSYEDRFGGPSEAGYTDYYCFMHPNDPNCEDVLFSVEAEHTGADYTEINQFSSNTLGTGN